MKTNELILRCYMKPAEGQYVAVCIDLCLAAQAETPNEAKRLLESQIESYVTEAFTVDKEFAPELLTRRAPIGQRFEYHAIDTLNKLHCLGASVRQVFNTIMPMTPGHICHA